MNITPWYYDHYEPNSFPHQQILCEKVRWTRCNLEGQVLSSDRRMLRGIAVNPLTLRLLSLRKAFNKLDREINKQNATLKKYLNSREKGKALGLGGKLHSADSQLKTGGAPIEEVTLDGGSHYLVYHNKIYFALYDFFTNAGSILDRLAFEINLLYSLGSWVGCSLDWNKITDTNKPFFTTLEKKDKNLTDFVGNEKPKFKKISPYRNRLTHDSIVKADLDFSLFRFKVLLPMNPNKVNSPRDIDARDLCKATKNDILSLLDKTYKLMLENTRNNGAPLGN